MMTLSRIVFPQVWYWNSSSGDPSSRVLLPYRVFPTNTLSWELPVCTPPHASAPLQ